MKKIFVIGMILSSFLYSLTVYEDAEDGNVSRWVASVGATVNNVTDNDTGSKVIKFSDSAYKYYMMGNLVSNSDNKIQWDIKTDSGFIAYVYVSTTDGNRLFYYTILNRDYGVTTSGIHHGLGEDKADGEWHTITRNLDAELHESESNNSVTSIIWFKLRAIGDTFVDNIKGYENNTTSPVITLIGDSNETIDCGDDYIEKGADAVDYAGGNVDVNTSGAVDTSTNGVYTITYTAVDSEGNSATKTRTVTVQGECPCSVSSVIEDAEDGTTNKWTAPGVIVTNEVDVDTGSKVIKLSSGVYKYSRMDNLNNPSKKIQWDIKTDSGFIAYVHVSTLDGDRLFYYTILNRDYGVTTSGIHHGVGEDKADGEWHTITRNLDAELHESESNNSVTAINSFKIRAIGDTFIDNMKGCSEVAVGL